MLTSEEKQRYGVHFNLDNFNEATQLKLKNASILVVGAGGLGCNVLLHLASMGIGQIMILDDDTVSVNNLQRQHFYTKENVGKHKAKIATERIKMLNPHGNYNFHLKRFSDHTTIKEFDIIVDCTDNLMSRYCIDQVSIENKIPFVFGGVTQFNGQIGVFGGNSVSFSKAFPNKVSNYKNETCNDSGVISPMVGIIGSLQAIEVFKLISHLGEPLASSLFSINALTYKTRKINFK